MSVAKAVRAGNSRLNEVFDNMLTTLRNFVKENRITHDEYRRAVAFMTEVGQKGEVSLLCDVFVEVSVDAVDNSGRSGTITTIEGPFYVHNAPILKSPCVLPQRPDESGPVLLFTGTVLSSKGEPLPGAVLDLWQSDNHGLYSHFDVPEKEAPYNLRARVTTDGQGKFDVQTRLPAPYEIPKMGTYRCAVGGFAAPRVEAGASSYEGGTPGRSNTYYATVLKKDPWIIPTLSKARSSRR